MLVLIFVGFEATEIKQTKNYHKSMKEKSAKIRGLIGRKKCMQQNENDTESIQFSKEQD